MLICFLYNMLIACGLAIGLVVVGCLVVWLLDVIDREFGGPWPLIFIVFLFIILMSVGLTLDGKCLIK